MKKSTLVTMLVLPVLYFLSGFCVDKFFEPYIGAVIFSFLCAWLLRNEKLKVSCIVTLVVSVILFLLAILCDYLGWDFFIFKHDWSMSSFTPYITNVRMSLEAQGISVLVATLAAYFLNND